MPSIAARALNAFGAQAWYYCQLFRLAGGRPVQIRTFHSWFAALLGSAPLGVLHHLGLPTQYELLENDAVAVAQVWRRFQTRVAGDAAVLADYLDAVRLYGRHQTHKALEAAPLDERTKAQWGFALRQVGHAQPVQAHALVQRIAHAPRHLRDARTPVLLQSLGGTRTLAAIHR